ncbi:hypothetical protein L218DRAFT_403532 [Marasmius fiardii PR-910]|nr:hypothetical protein L218DRAFT_403532 [Marasmius fiardii PR-910]
MIETVIYTAMIIPFGNERFTVKAYSGGRKAKKKWRRDFLRCSNDWRRDIPLFGYSKSSVPLLIFHGVTWPIEEFRCFYNVIFSELVPIAHIKKGLGDLGGLYIEFLRLMMGCSTNELWMDPTKGRFCCGPPGPKCEDWDGDYSGVIIPSDAEFLKEDIIIRYLSTAKDDRGLFWALNYSSQFVLAEEIPLANYHQIISILTNSTIAFYRNVYWWSWKGCLDLGEGMPDGMTRFQLKHDQRFIEISSVRETTSWISQALSVFHVHDIGLDENLSDYELVYPQFMLRGTLPRQFYFWSHDRIGRIPLSRDRCKCLGLPFKLSIKVEYHCQSWPTKILHDFGDPPFLKLSLPRAAFKKSRKQKIFRLKLKTLRFPRRALQTAHNQLNLHLRTQWA